MSVIKTTNLTKDYSGLVAVDNLNLNVKESEIFGLLGPNGAGKTTSIRLLVGMLKPTQGTAEVLGYDIKTQSNTIRENVGILTETASHYDRLTVRDNLKFHGRLYLLPKTELEQRIESIADLFDLKDKLDTAAGTLSKGMKQKLAIARALIHDPELLFLDEPTSSLSPEAARTVRDLIVKLTKQQKRTVFINTHNLVEAERLCTRVGILEKGKLIAIGSPNELRSLLQGETVTTFRFKTWTKSIPDYFGSLQAKIIEKNQSEMFYTVKLNDIDDQTPKIIKDLVDQNVLILEVSHNRPSLEKVYLELVDGEIKGNYKEGSL